VVDSKSHRHRKRLVAPLRREADRWPGLAGDSRCRYAERARHRAGHRRADGRV